MVQAKTDLFSQELNETAELFKALSHPARLQILQFIANAENCITGDISEELPLGRTTVNQHLKELKTVGLIRGHIDGAKTKYCLNPERIKQLQKLSSNFISQINITNYNCK